MSILHPMLQKRFKGKRETIFNAMVLLLSDPWIIFVVSFVENSNFGISK